MWIALIILLDGDPPEKLLTHPDHIRRLQAIRAVRERDDLPRTRALLPLLGDPHPRVRLRAGRALCGISDPASIELLTGKGLRSASPEIRRSICRILGAVPAIEPLTKALRDRDPTVRGEAAMALGASGDPSVCDALAEAFARDRTWPLRAHALEALAKLDPSRAESLHECAARDRHYQVRLVAAEVRPTEKLVADRDWRVRAAAFASCLKNRARPAIGWLINQFGREKGRLRWDLLKTLTDLTGRDLGLKPEPWKLWWNVNKLTFEVPPAGGAGPSLRGTRASFFKVPILSTRMIFVLDLSGSMRDPAPGGTGSKLDAAREGMIGTLRTLTPAARFGITGLGCDAKGRPLDPEKKTWGKLRLFPAVPAVKANAARFLSRLEARGWTNLYDGIAFAFRNPNVDTLYLYSDGGATNGTFVSQGDILDRLSALNRFRKIVIHTVEVEGRNNPERNRRLLARIAEATGGTCRLK